jgi:hypothetical protein
MGRPIGEMVAQIRAEQHTLNTKLLPAAERLAKAAARERERTGANTRRIGETGRLVRQVPMIALMNAVRTEGKAVLKREGEAYWRDMARRHPEIGGAEAGVSLSGTRNRFGRVTARLVVGADGVGRWVNTK